MTWQPQEILIESYKSPELIARFQEISEQTTKAGPRFQDDTCRKLQQIVACRNFASPLFQLCHLLNIADACVTAPSRELRVFRFFQESGPARSSAFRGYISNVITQHGWRRSGFEMNDSSVAITYEKKTFRLHYKDIPLLAALLEFCLSTVGYASLRPAFDRLLEGNVTYAAVSDCSSSLHQLLYEYLKPHLPEVQQQRQFHTIVNYCKDALGDEAWDELIDDETLLRFWCANSTNESDSFKGYKTVFWAFVRLLRMTEIMRNVVGTTRNLQPFVNDEGDGDFFELLSFEAGGRSPFDDPVDQLIARSVFEAITTLEDADESDPLEMLDASPANAIKFFTGKERKVLREIMAAGSAIKRLPLSLLRHHTYSPLQDGLIQAMRNRETDSDLTIRLSEIGKTTFDDAFKQFERMRDHVAQLLLASLHSLIHARESAAFSIILSVCPQVDLSALLPQSDDDVDAHDFQDDTVVSLSARRTATNFFDAVETLDQLGAEVSDILRTARQSHRAINRQGFRQLPDVGSKTAAGFAASTDALLRLKSVTDDLVTTLGDLTPPAGDWGRQAQADNSIFHDQFELLYAGTQ